MGEHESTRVKAKVTSFIPANEFEGPKAGYFFKKGKKGLGYYLDKRGNKEKLKKASKEAKQTKSKAEKSKSETKVSTNVSDNVPKKRKMHAEDSENESATEELLAANNDKVDEPPKSFKELGVVPELVAACESIGWTNATPIQVEAIPPALEGRDLIALAETGSGKTGAFSLPLLQGLLKHQQRLYATVLAPTRELAFQINEVVTALGAPIGCKCVCVVGGIDMMSQQIALAKKPHVVIATPGRLIDHLEKTKGFNLRSLKLLVLDEADRMLSMDFEEELNKLLTVIPRDRNTYLFSATMTSKVAKLQRASLRNPVKVEVSSKYQTVKQLNQQYLFVPAKYKDCYLTYVLNELAGQTCLVFTSTCAHAQKATMMLRNLGFQALCLHGQMSQSKRLGALSKFKAGSRNILIATDVASRGLDIPSVGLVVNYDVPSNGKDYIHRVGRTARAGRAGRAVTLVTQYDVEVYTRIEEMIGKKLEQFPAEKEAVLVMYERVFEAQRVAALEMREMNQGNKRYRDDGDEEGGDVAGLMDTFRGRGGRRGGRGGSRGGGRGGSRGRRGRR